MSNENSLQFDSFLSVCMMVTAYSFVQHNVTHDYSVLTSIMKFNWKQTKTHSEKQNEVLELEITLFSTKNACKEWPIGFMIWPIEILRKGPWAHLVKIFPYHCRFYYFLLSVNLKTGLIRGVIFEGGGLIIGGLLSYHFWNSFSQLIMRDTGMTIIAACTLSISNNPDRKEIIWIVFPNLQKNTRIIDLKYSRNNLVFLNLQKTTGIIDLKYMFVCLMAVNATLNNISVISWWSVLLMEETIGPRETTDLSQVTDKLYHIMLYTSPCRGWKFLKSDARH